jgi:hypothetical protein
LDPERPRDLWFFFPDPAREVLVQQLPQLAKEQQSLLQLAAAEGLPAGQNLSQGNPAGAMTVADAAGSSPGTEPNASDGTGSNSATMFSTVGPATAGPPKMERQSECLSSVLAMCFFPFQGHTPNMNFPLCYF